MGPALRAEHPGQLQAPALEATGYHDQPQAVSGEGAQLGAIALDKDDAVAFIGVEAHMVALGEQAVPLLAVVDAVLGDNDPSGHARQHQATPVATDTVTTNVPSCKRSGEPPTAAGAASAASTANTRGSGCTACLGVA